MQHDSNGRVGPPRCEECNAPLGPDDVYQLCQECFALQLQQRDFEVRNEFSKS
jgi:hypothetical protein